MAKDPEVALFKRLEGLQPCEISELKAGSHVFAVYGDNFFKPASYTIEALCAKSYEDTTQKLKDIEAKILTKRNELSQFEIEYRKALAHFREVTKRYEQEKQSEIERYKLGHPKTFHYLNQSNCYELVGISDAHDYLATRRAMDIVGISQKEQDAIFRVVASVHHWILTVINPHKEIVHLLDPLYHGNKDGRWTNVVNLLPSNLIATNVVFM